METALRLELSRWWVVAIMIVTLLRQVFGCVGKVSRVHLLDVKQLTSCRLIGVLRNIS